MTKKESLDLVKKYMKGTMMMLQLQRIYRFLHLNSLKRILRFWFIFLLLLFIVLSSFPFSLYGREYRETEAQNNIQQTINLQQLVVDKWFEDKISTILTISQLSSVRAMEKEKIKQLLDTFAENKTEFSRIVFVNKQGMSEVDSSGLPSIDISDRLYFQEAQKGNSYVTDLLIEKQSNEDVIVFSSPVFDGEKNFQGVIFGSVRLDTINKVMEKFRFSETGQTYLVNREGILLTETRFPHKGENNGINARNRTKINTEVFQQAMQGKSITKSYQNYQGSAVFGDYRWVNNGKWLIIGEIEKDDVFAPFQKMMMIFTGALVIVLLTGLIITFRLSKQVDQVYHQIIEGSRQMEGANYSYRIERSSYEHCTPDLEKLCETFNQMAEMLQFQMHSVQQSEERYRALIESSPNAIVVHQEGKIVYVNPGFKDLLKATPKDKLIGRPITEYVHSDYHEIVKERIHQLEENKPVGASEQKYILLDGSIVDVEVIATPIRYMDKPAFQIIIQNISKRKEIERELKDSEERFRLLAEYSSDMISMHDSTGKYLYVSPACKEILQYEEKELIGQDAFFFIHPEDYELAQTNQQTLQKLNPGYKVSTYRIRRKDGQYVWFESAAKLLKETHLGEQKQIVVSRNISERKCVEEKLQEANEILQHLSTVDGLTGVSNRRAFDERLELEWKRSYRHSAFLSLIMLDIDDFKAYNDTYGHQGGDDCLKQVASVIQNTLGRSTDLLCRYGGEEFCIILPDTNEEGAIKVGEKIRSAIEALKIPHAGSKLRPSVTISVGIATMIPTVCTSFANLVSNADKAVYQAKRDGRNCVRSYE